MKEACFDTDLLITSNRNMYILYFIDRGLHTQCIAVILRLVWLEYFKLLLKKSNTDEY